MTREERDEELEANKTLDFDEFKKYIHVLIEVHKHSFNLSIIQSIDPSTTAPTGLPTVGPTNVPTPTRANVDPLTPQPPLLMTSSSARSRHDLHLII